jgi:signal transduction histidine kinase
MITTIFKVPVFRYSIIFLLFALLCGITFYISNQYAKAQKLHHDVEKLLAIKANASQIDSCILTLYNADNDTRLFSVTGDARYLAQFARQIKEVDSILGHLSKTRDFSANSSSKKILDLMDRKSTKTTDYLRLRDLSDSLIASSLKNHTIVNSKEHKKNLANIATDTILGQKEKKLLGRLFGAFSRNQSGHSPSKQATSKSSQKTDTALIASLAAAPYLTYYRKLNAATSKMKAKEREMLYINSSILHELIATLKNYKNEETYYVNLHRKQLKSNLNLIFSGFSELTILAIALFLGLIATMAYNLWKIFRHERWLVSYSEKANRVALEKSTFLANMSHEIRTPLNSIAGFAEQLENGPLNPEQAVQIKAISSSADLLLNVVNQVLDFSKYENGKMNFDSAPFRLHKVIKEIIVSMGVLAQQKALYLHTELDYDETVFLVGDAFRLRQVMMNLVGNAIKFTSKGGILLKVWLVQPQGLSPELHIEITDTGIGISAQHLPLIFKEFTQAGAGRQQNRSGTGLGLAISKSIIELQGGEITVQSEQHKGSVFRFQIPFEIGEKESLPGTAVFDESSARILLRDKHVLLAEDNSMNVLLATTILQKWNMTYEVAYNGKEALSLFKKTDFDLVMTDIQMPEMDGVELTAEIRGIADPEKAKIPILAITANVAKEDHEVYFSSGIDAIALKPFFEKELIDKIDSLLKNFNTGRTDLGRA